MGKKIFLLAAMFLCYLALTPLTLAECEICGDVNGSGGDPEMQDIADLINYLYISHTPVTCPDQSDVDGIPGITHNDLLFLINSVFTTSEILYCPPPPDTVPPVYPEDTLIFQNTIVPAGETSWQVEIWEMNNNHLYGMCIPIQYGCPNSEYTLTSIDITGTRYDPFLTAILHPTEPKALIYSQAADGSLHIPPGEGFVARLNFTLDAAPFDRQIIIDTTHYNEYNQLLYTTIIGSQSFAYVPVLINIKHPNDFTATKTMGKTPMVVRFDPLLDCTPDEYYWDFGDGGFSTDPTAIHTYTTEGIYDVKLRLTYDLGGPTFVDSIVKEEYIHVTQLEADFTANPSYGVAPLLVQFTDQSKGTPISWYWEFGDGEFSTDANPSHQYDTAGIYDVKLTIDDGTFTDFMLKPDFIRVDTLFTDLQTDIYSDGAQTGLEVAFYCGYGVIGTYPAENCTLKVLPPPQVEITTIYDKDILSGQPLEYFYAGDTIEVPLATVEPLKWPGGYYVVEGTVPLSVPNGTVLRCESWVTTTTLETTYDNNYADYSTVVGAIDPLFYKTGSPAGIGAEKIIGAEQRLTFRLEFENNPEAVSNAQYIWVEDTLDPNFDFSTVALGAVSHEACELTYKVYNDSLCIVSGECIDIDLPPNTTPGIGEGYFTFSVKPKAGIDPGTVVENRAWIYVDQVQPIPAPFESPVYRTIGGTCCSHSYAEGMTGDTDCSGIETPDISDIVRLIDYLYLSHDPLCCFDEVDVDASNQGPELEPDISDITKLIDHLYLNHSALAPCP